MCIGLLNVVGGESIFGGVKLSLRDKIGCSKISTTTGAFAGTRQVSCSLLAFFCLFESTSWPSTPCFADPVSESADVV